MLNNLKILEDKNGWGDNFFQYRKNIANKIALFLSITYGNNFLKQETIIIRPLSTHEMRNCCGNNTTYPCTCPGRGNICISSTGQHWCQFVYQLSHEFCHCITTRFSFPQSVKWFDEFLACFTSLLVMDYLSKDDLGIRKLYKQGFSVVMKDYLDDCLRVEQDYEPDTCKLFAQNHSSYIEDENKIKLHKVYALKLFFHVRNKRVGLTFIGKICQLEFSSNLSISDFLLILKTKCNNEERQLIDYISNEIFGLRKECIA